MPYPDQQQKHRAPGKPPQGGTVSRFPREESETQPEQESVQRHKLALEQGQDQPIHGAVNAMPGGIGRTEGGDIDYQDAKQGESTHDVNGGNAFGGRRGGRGVERMHGFHEKFPSIIQPATIIIPLWIQGPCPTPER